MAAQLELDTAVARGRLVAHGASHRNRAGERDRLDARVRDELRADLRARARKHVQHACGQPGLGEALRDVEAGARRFVAELEDEVLP